MPSSARSRKLTSTAARLSLLALAVGAIAVTGCGGGGDGGSNANDDYAAELKAAFGPLGQVLSDVAGAASTATSRAEIEAALSDAQDGMQETIDAVEAIDAPSGLTDENDDLVQALNDYSDALAATEQAIASGDLASVKDLKARSEDFAATLGQIKQRLVDAGVDLKSG